MEKVVIEELISYWGSNAQNPLKEKDIDRLLSSKDIVLPEDFEVLYKYVNGIKEQDNEGFLFYKLEDLRTMGSKFNLEGNNSLKDIVLFGDYMLSSWWYGLKVNHDRSYEVGIVPTSMDFKMITCSLAKFIKLYMEDSPLLYEY